jgi:hypothetical protein
MSSARKTLADTHRVRLMREIKGLYVKGNPRLPYSPRFYYLKGVEWDEEQKDYRIYGVRNILRQNRDIRKKDWRYAKELIVGLTPSNDVWTFPTQT